MKIEQYNTVSQLTYTDVSKINEEGQMVIGICDDELRNFSLRLNNDISKVVPKTYM